MEICLTQAEGVPDGSVVFIRAGSTRRQLRLGQPFQFPLIKEKVGPLQFDILAPIGKARDVKVNSSESSYIAALELAGPAEQQNGLLKFEANDIGKKFEANDIDEDAELSAYDTTGFDANDKTLSAAELGKIYLEHHGLLKIVQDVLQNVIHEKPDDPRKFICKLLWEGDIAQDEDRPALETPIEFNNNSQQEPELGDRGKTVHDEEIMQAIETSSERNTNDKQRMHRSTEEENNMHLETNNQCQHESFVSQQQGDVSPPAPDEVLGWMGTLALNTPGKYEAKDVLGDWWPITLTGFNRDESGTYTAVVGNQQQTKWPIVYTGNIRLSQVDDNPGVDLEGKEVKELEELENAAVKIQSVHRGRTDRKEFEKKRDAEKAKQERHNISVGITLNIDYQQLSTDDKDELRDNMRDILATSAGVDQTAVSVTLTPGSVQVDAEIQTPDANSAKSIEKSMNKSIIAPNVSKAVNSIPGVKAAVTEESIVGSFEVKAIFHPATAKAETSMKEQKTGSGTNCAAQRATEEKPKQEEEKAAVKIQSQHRGNASRKELEKKKLEAQVADDVEEQTRELPVCGSVNPGSRVVARDTPCQVEGLCITQPNPTQQTRKQKEEKLGARRATEEEQEQEKAAVKIQSQYRGNASRKELEAKKHEAQKADVEEQTRKQKEEELAAKRATEQQQKQEEEKAAVKIQSQHRGNASRKELEAKKLAAQNADVPAGGCVTHGLETREQVEKATIPAIAATTTPRHQNRQVVQSTGIMSMNQWMNELNSRIESETASSDSCLVRRYLPVDKPVKVTGTSIANGDEDQLVRMKIVNDNTVASSPNLQSGMANVDKDQPIRKTIDKNNIVMSSTNPSLSSSSSSSPSLPVDNVPVSPSKQVVVLSAEVRRLPQETSQCVVPISQPVVGENLWTAPAACEGDPEGELQSAGANTIVATHHVPQDNVAAIETELPGSATQPLPVTAISPLQPSLSPTAAAVLEKPAAARTPSSSVTAASPRAIQRPLALESPNTAILNADDNLDENLLASPCSHQHATVVTNKVVLPSKKADTSVPKAGLAQAEAVHAPTPPPIIVSAPIFNQNKVVFSPSHPSSLSTTAASVLGGGAAAVETVNGEDKVAQIRVCSEQEKERKPLYSSFDFSKMVDTKVTAKLEEAPSRNRIEPKLSTVPQPPPGSCTSSFLGRRNLKNCNDPLWDELTKKIDEGTLALLDMNAKLKAENDELKMKL